MITDFLTLLTCPQTKKELKNENDSLTCNDQKYPLINGIPWLFKGPERAFLSWAGKIQQYQREELNYQQFLQQKANSTKNPLAKKRITKILEARRKNLKTMDQTLEVFKMERSLQGEIHTQQIHSYFELIFRDWVWEEDEETNYYNDFLTRNIPDDKDLSILVLGAGASGLSYKLAQNRPQSKIISFDHNPFLIFTAAKIFNGHEVKLSDYSTYPNALENTTKLYKIKKEKLNQDNHLHVLGRFPDLPFKEQSFDIIVAPWFFDILDYDFGESINYSKKFLKTDGKLLFFGPSNVHKNNIENQLTPDEIQELFTFNFKEVDSHKKRLTYLNNPIQSQVRSEQILFISAGHKIDTKTQELNKPELILKYTPELENYKALNQTFFHILKHIDKDISADDLAIKIHQEFGFSPEESLQYADNFILKLQYEIN